MNVTANQGHESTFFGGTSVEFSSELNARGLVVSFQLITSEFLVFELINSRKLSVKLVDCIVFKCDVDIFIGELGQAKRKNKGNGERRKQEGKVMLSSSPHRVS